MKRVVYRWLTPVNRAFIERRLGEGAGFGVVGGELGCSVMTVRRAQADLVLRRQARRCDSGFRLSLGERLEIKARVGCGESDAQIARALGRHRSTIGREIARCGTRRGHYAPYVADRRAVALASRPKETKLVQNERLLGEVVDGLKKRWSHEQISARLKVDWPDDLGMRISHETIYMSLFVQSRGALRKDLTAYLRTGRTVRKPQGRSVHRRIVGMVSISERPAEIEDRAVPGHWEGDLIIGAAQKSAIVTLVERQTRFVMLAYLGDSRSTERVVAALEGRVRRLPDDLMRTLTWDQGTEMAGHRKFTVDSGVQVYFCDPHSPWQRGSNENTNGLLRQYFPKGTDLSVHTQADLDQVADELNGRPRETLGWATPAEKIAQLLDQAATQNA